MVKLTNEEINWLIIRVGSGFFTVKKAAAVYGVTERHVQQLIKMQRETGRSVPNPRKQQKRKRADTNVSIRVAWYTATGTGLRRTIRTNALIWLDDASRRAWRLPAVNLSSRVQYSYR